MFLLYNFLTTKTAGKLDAHFLIRMLTSYLFTNSKIMSTLALLKVFFSKFTQPAKILNSHCSSFSQNFKPKLQKSRTYLPNVTLKLLRNRRSHLSSPIQMTLIFFFKNHSNSTYRNQPYSKDYNHSKQL